jgi:hypothetical protein
MNREVFEPPRPSPGLLLCLARGTAAIAGTGRGARRRRPGATGHSSITQPRNPASVDLGANTSRSSHNSRPPRIASGVVSSSARVSLSARWRAIAQARMTPISVSLASAYTTGGITQIARSRHP